MDSKVIIVDENDKEIGLKERGLLEYEDIYRISGLWLSNSKGEVLLAQRNFSKKHNAGMWGPAVSGTVEEGETYESNIYKESDEEIGLTDCKYKLGPKIYMDDGVQKFFVQWFVCEQDRDVDEFDIQADEVEQIKWIPRSQLVKDVEENPDNYASSDTWKNFLE